MSDAIAGERLVLGASRTLVADEIGICAAQTGGAHGFVSIDHDVVLGGLGHWP